MLNWDVQFCSICHCRVHNPEDFSVFVRPNQLLVKAMKFAAILTGMCSFKHLGAAEAAGGHRDERTLCRHAVPPRPPRRPGRAEGPAGPAASRLGGHFARREAASHRPAPLGSCATSAREGRRGPARPDP